MGPKKISPHWCSNRQIIHPLLCRYKNYAIVGASYDSARIYKPSKFSAIFSYSVLLVSDWKSSHLGWILGTLTICYVQYKIFSTISVLSSPLQRARDTLQHKGLCYRLGFMCSTFSRNGNNNATYFPRLFPFLLDESDRNCIHRLYNVDSNDALCTELTDSISCKWIRLIGKFTIRRWISASLLTTWQSPFLYKLSFKNARPKYN